MLSVSKKKQALSTVKRNEYIEISFQLKTTVFKNKKKYTRKVKHKSI